MTRHVTMKNASTLAHTVELLNADEALIVWHKTIELIAYARLELKAIHWYHVYVEFANTMRIVWMTKLAIDWIVCAVKSVILIRVQKMHVVKDESINQHAHVYLDCLEIRMLNAHANAMNHSAVAIQIVRPHWHVWINGVKIHAPDQMFATSIKLAQF